MEFTSSYSVSSAQVRMEGKRGDWEGPGPHLEDLIGAEAGKHEGVPLHIQDGTGHEQVQIRARESCPQHLRVTEGGVTAQPLPEVPPRSAPAHLPQFSHPSWLAHLPQSKDIQEGEFPLEPDEQPPEAEAERAGVLRV